MTTAAAELSNRGMRGLTWQQMNPGGRVLIDVITNAIDECDVAVAEISSMNKNVLFEAGYALAKNKGLLFAIDESLESAHRLWEGVQLFSTIGRLDYHGNGLALADLVSTSLATAATSESLLTGILADSKPQQMNAVFAPTVPVRFQVLTCSTKSSAIVAASKC